jgi:putative ABC transport system permease protein
MALRDVRFAFRILKNNPGFAAVSILALALGTGANTAIFTAVDSILIRPLPYPQPDRLVNVWEDASFAGFPRNTPAPANYYDWKEQNTVFEDVAASRFRTMTLRGEGAPEEVRGRAVTPNFFSVLQVSPAIGRVFSADEDRRQVRVVVVSHGFWIRRFGGEASAIGKVVNINGEPTQVVGVMPRGFFFPDRRVEAWIPANLETERTRRGSHFLQVVARMKPGVTLPQARADMATIAKRLEAQYPDTNSKLGSVVNPIRDDMTGNTSVALLALLGAAGCVLLIACANLANLLLARASGRTREVAVRLAVGADRKSLVTQLLTESLVLSMLGGLLGLGLAAAATYAMDRMLPRGLAEPLQIDLRAFLFAFSVAALSGVLFGLAPAIQSARLDLQTALKHTGRTGSSRAQALLRDALVAAEFALAFVLLIGAGLLIQTMVKLESVDLGFQPDRILTGRIALLQTKYNDDEKIRAFYREAITKISATPGVESAAFAGTLPYVSIGNTCGFDIEGRTSERDWDALYRSGTPNYLPLMGVRLVKGRHFNATDIATSKRVLLINETFDRLYWPGGDSLGKRVSLCGQGNWTEIIGVVRDMRERGADVAMKPVAYPSVEQERNPGANTFVVRTHGDPKLMANTIRQVIQAIDPGIPVSQVLTMDDILDANTANRRYPMEVMAVFAALALLLAAIGVYGVLSYSVAQRVREIGLRMALGADPSSVARMVAMRGLALGAIGLGAGLAGSLLVMRLLQTVLYEVSPNDPYTIVSAAAILTVVAAVASYMPAWRAARVDPLIALRDE